MTHSCADFIKLDNLCETVGGQDIQVLLYLIFDRILITLRLVEYTCNGNETANNNTTETVKILKTFLQNLLN